MDNDSPPMMAFPFPLPPWMQQHGPPPPDSPPRVKTALDCLVHFTHKTMTRVAMNGVSIEEIDGQKLTVPEVAVEQAACRTLVDYLRGRLEPDVWEHADLGPTYPTQAGMLLRCWFCAGIPEHARANCQVCRGAGQILVFPTRGNPEPQPEGGES